MLISLVFRFQYMRHRGRPKCSLPFTANAHNGSMGPNRVYKSFTEIISNESTDLSVQWNVVSLHGE